MNKAIIKKITNSGYIVSLNDNADEAYVPKKLTLERSPNIDLKIGDEISIAFNNKSIKHNLPVYKEIPYSEIIRKEDLPIEESIINQIFSSNINSTMFQKMIDDYNATRGVWVFSFLEFLKIDAIESFKNKDYEKSLMLIDSYFEGSSFVKRSHLMHRFMKSYDVIQAQVKKLNKYKNAIDFIISDNSKKFSLLFMNLIDQDGSIRQDTISLFNVIIRMGDYNVLLDSQIEKLYNEVKSWDDEKSKAYLFTAAIHRKKLLRKKLFPNFTGNYSHLIGNKDLKHLIFLQEIDVEYIKMQNHKDELIINLAILERLKSHYVEKTRDFKKHVFLAIKFLKPRKIDFNISEFFDTKEEKEKYYARLNNEIALNYEIIAIRSKSDTARKKYLQYAFNHYFLAKAKRGFLISTIMYLDGLINMINTSDNGLSEIRLESQKLSNRWNNESFQNLIYQKYPVVTEIDIIFNILSYFGDDSMQSIEYLMDIQSYNLDNLTNIDIVKLSKIVLSHNYLIELNDIDLIYIPLIQQLFNDVTLNINDILSNETIDDDNELLSYLDKEEDSLLEFKGGIYFDIKNFIYTNERKESYNKVTKSLLKTITGMFNQRGGTVVIGVLELAKWDNNEVSKISELLNGKVHDNKIITGITSDLDLKGIDVDTMIQKLSDLIRNNIGKDEDIGPYFNIEYNSFKSHIILIIKLRPIYKETGIWLKNPDDILEFYIREGNSTQLLSQNKAIRYLIRRSREGKEINIRDVKN